MTETEVDDPKRPFMFANHDKCLIVTRPRVGDPDTVVAIQTVLEEKSTRNELDFPRLLWWLPEDSFKEFVELYSDYIFKQ